MTFPVSSARSLRSIATLALMVLAVSLCLAPLASAQKNLLYINSNVSVDGQNSIIALENDGAGNLSPLPGSPYPTLGTGVAGVGDPTKDAQWDSDQETVIDPSGKLLLAVNGHSNNLSSFLINADGTLNLVAGSPVPSGGIQPASIGFLPNALGNSISLAVIVNKNADPFQQNSGTVPNYTTFQVGPRGIFKMNAGSNYPLPKGAAPAQALVPPTGRAAFFGMEFLNGTVSSYTLDRQGIISKVNSLTPPGSTPYIVGGVAHPNVRGFYVGLPPQSQIGVYSYDTGMLMTYIKEVANAGMAPCWLAINKQGTRLYTSETVSGTMSVYDITNSRTPVQIQHMAVAPTGTTPYPAHLKLDASGKFLYILDRNGFVHVLDVNGDGTVAENHTPYGLSLPAGTVPLGLSVLTK